MNSIYIYDYVGLMERVLSYAYENGYSFRAIEKEIAYSPFFQSLEKNDGGLAPIIGEKELFKSIFHIDDADLMPVPTYNQCLWVAESYLRIQKETRLTFEAIFLYIPITNMFHYFPIYHEMDYSHIIEEFNRLYLERSVLAILLEKHVCSLKSVSDKIGLPYASLYSYKQRRRDIKKMSAEAAYSLSSLFRVRIETLLELHL